MYRPARKPCRAFKPGKRAWPIGEPPIIRRRRYRPHQHEPQTQTFSVPRNGHVVASLVEQFERVERTTCTKATVTHTCGGSSAKAFGPTFRGVPIDLTYATTASGVAI